MTSPRWRYCFSIPHPRQVNLHAAKADIPCGLHRGIDGLEVACPPALQLDEFGTGLAAKLHGEPAEFGKNRTLRFSGHP